MKKYNKFLSYGYILLFSLGLSSCSKTMTKLEMFPKIFEERPLSIVILPPINESTAADADEYYLTTIAEPLSLTGYYVYPVEVVMDALKTEGIYDAGNMGSISPAKFKEYFGADAVMLVKIVKWNKSYYVVGGNVTVTIEFVLKSTKTGETIWTYSGTIVLDTSGNSGNSNSGGLAGLIAQLVVTAVSTAVTDYTPVARGVNVKALTSIPFGKYHKQYDTDRSIPVVVQPKKLEKEEKK